MSDPKSKALPDLFSMYFIMLLLYCADVFLLKSDLTVLGDNFYSSFLCLTVLTLTVLFKRENLKSFGIGAKTKKIGKSFFYGILFSVGSMAVVFAAEYAVVYKFCPSELKLSFIPPNFNFVKTEGYLTPLFCISVYLTAAVFSVCFKETFFRGFMLNKLEKLMGFGVANAFQAALYALFYVPKLVRNFLDNVYTDDIKQIAVFVIIFYVIHEFITGFKWGMVAKKSGAVYISIVDHFLYVFLSDSVNVISAKNQWIFMAQMLAIQLVSLLIVFVYTRVAPDDMPEKAEKKANPQVQLNSVYSSESVDAVKEISPEDFKTVTKEQARKMNIPQMSEAEIDEFLRDFNKPKHGGFLTAESHDETVDIENFDVDNFLQDYSMDDTIKLQ